MCLLKLHVTSVVACDCAVVANDFCFLHLLSEVACDFCSCK
jgi:hypothetical protein